MKNYDAQYQEYVQARSRAWAVYDKLSKSGMAKKAICADPRYFRAVEAEQKTYRKAKEALKKLLAGD